MVTSNVLFKWFLILWSEAAFCTCFSVWTIEVFVDKLIFVRAFTIMVWPAFNDRIRSLSRWYSSIVHGQFFESFCESINWWWWKGRMMMHIILGRVLHRSSAAGRCGGAQKIGGQARLCGHGLYGPTSRGGTATNCFWGIGFHQIWVRLLLNCIRQSSIITWVWRIFDWIQHYNLSLLHCSTRICGSFPRYIRRQAASRYGLASRRGTATNCFWWIGFHQILVWLLLNCIWQSSIITWIWRIFDWIQRYNLSQLHCSMHNGGSFPRYNRRQVASRHGLVWRYVVCYSSQ